MFNQRKTDLMQFIRKFRFEMPNQEVREKMVGKAYQEAMEQGLSFSEGVTREQVEKQVDEVFENARK